MIKLHSLSYGPFLRAALARAEKNIYISTYVTVLNPKKKNDLVNILFIILKQRLLSGVDIRFLVDHPRIHKPNYHATQFLIRRLKEWKFPFWMAPLNTTCHAKIVLIDDQLVFVGSHNLAKSSFQNPLELSLSLSDSPTCRSVKNWFEEKFQSPGFRYFPPDHYNIPDIYP